MRASACASPGKAEGGTGTPPPQKKNRGGRGGGAREQPTAPKLPANTTRGGQTPNPEGTEDRTPKEAQGDHPAKTGNTKPGTAAHREKGHRNMQTHTTLEEKKNSQQPSPKERGWGDRDHKARDKDSQQPTPQSQTKTLPKKQSAKNTPRQPNQKGRGTAETRAQHARRHSAPQPGKAGNKRGPRTNTHPRTAPPTRRCRRPRGTGARAHTIPNTGPRKGGAQPKPKLQHARPHRTPEPETAGGRRSAHANHTRPISRPKPKPNHGQHEQPAKQGQHQKPYPNTPRARPCNRIYQFVF